MVSIASHRYDSEIRDDILIDREIPANTAFSFIVNTLWKNNTDKETQLKLHIKDKKDFELLEIKKLKFSQDVISFYVIFIAFIIMILFNLK